MSGVRWCKPDERGGVDDARASVDPRLPKAMKLLEAMCEPHAEGKPDHAWRECRACLAHFEAETPHGRELLAVLKAALKAKDREY